MLALLSNNVKLRADRHNQLLIDDSIPLKFTGDPSAASVFLEFKKVFETALLAGMQNICEIWPSDRRKAFPTGLSDVILLAVQELLEYEEGQSKRREGDVGKFSLGPEKEEWSGEEKNVTATTWKPMGASYSELHEPSEEIIFCGICGQTGHDYDNCPRNTTSHRQRRSMDTLSTLTPWDPSADVTDAAISYNSNAFDEDNQGLSELPGEIDYRGR
jgi:hypothetical protein